MDPERQPGIKIAQIFLGRAQFGHAPNVLALPANTPVPEQKINVTMSAGITEDKTAGIVSVLVETHPEDNGPYSFLVEMIGLIEAEAGEAANMTVEDFITHNGPTAMFPFLREALANLTGRGRFGPVWLKPFNVGAATKKVVEKEATEAGPE